jgi:hypothetical protein
MSMYVVTVLKKKEKEKKKKRKERAERAESGKKYEQTVSLIYYYYILTSFGSQIKQLVSDSPQLVLSPSVDG